MNLTDSNGIKKLWQVSEKHVAVTPDTLFLTNGKHEPGWQPYNNFHILSISFWSSAKWMSLWNKLNEEHGFFKYCMGDTTVHAIAVMLFNSSEYRFWEVFPYSHNYSIVDYPLPEWQFECTLVKKLLSNMQVNSACFGCYGGKKNSSPTTKNITLPPNGKRAFLIPDSCETSTAMLEFEKLYEAAKLKILTKEDFSSNARWPPKSHNADSGVGSQLGQATKMSLDIIQKLL
jgi:hypothetical protein